MFYLCEFQAEFPANNSIMGSNEYKIFDYEFYKTLKTIYIDKFFASVHMDRFTSPNLLKHIKRLVKGWNQEKTLIYIFISFYIK